MISEVRVPASLEPRFGLVVGLYYTEGKDVVAVDDVSIKIEEGEVVGLAGESGSGKTTLGSIISLIARPPLHVEHGTLEIDGQVQELGGHAKIPRTWRGAVVSMLPQGAMNSISPTKRIRSLVYDVMRSHESKISKEEALDRARDRLTTLGLRPASSTLIRTSSPEA
jgi:peptide/nickel transport system ATP-binding protein